jgi:gamma-glutamylcyclotransferase (GGCT)/AIG2-like uncharacterized protein YtfP
MTNKSLIEELGELAARWEAVGAQLCPLRTELGRAQGATELRALISKHSASSEAGEKWETCDVYDILREAANALDDLSKPATAPRDIAAELRVLHKKLATETKAEPVAWMYRYRAMPTVFEISRRQWIAVADEWEECPLYRHD